MQIDKTSCLELLNEFGLTPSKDKGQNYLINPVTAKKIADSLIVEEADKVLEIGPGLGSLTNFLEEKALHLTVIDVDEKSCEVLKDLYPSVNIVNQDALKANLSSYNKVISNVPYSITSDLLEYVLLKATKAKQCVFMVEEDAYKRIVSLKGKDYGPLSVLIHLQGKPKTLFKVSPSDFYPRPKCVSIVFSVVLNDKRIIEKEYKVIKTLFANRRKTLLNNLLSLTSKDNATALINNLELPLTVRPEELSPETYYKLVSLYYSKGQ